MNNTYRINAHFAVSKALDAVKSWEVALEIQQAKQDQRGINFCAEQVKACQGQLTAVRESIKNVQMWS